MLAVLVVAIALGSAPGAQGFQQTRWGMTPDDIRKLYPAARAPAETLPPEMKDDLETVVDVADDHLRTRFRFMEGRLAAVELALVDTQKFVDARVAAAKAQGAATEAALNKYIKTTADLNAEQKQRLGAAKSEAEIELIGDDIQSRLNLAVAQQKLDDESADRTAEAEMQRVNAELAKEKARALLKFYSALKTKYGKPKEESLSKLSALEVSDPDSLADAIGRGGEVDEVWRTKAAAILLEVGEHATIMYEDPRILAKKAAEEKAQQKAATKGL